MELPRDAFDLDPDEIRRRFDWARERGLWRWLWPDVAPEAWRRALTDIAAATGRVLSGLTADVPLIGDGGALGLAAYTSGMGPLLGHWIETDRLRASPEAGAILRLHLRHNRDRMARLEREAVKLAGTLREQGATATVLKGMHTAFAYFPTPETRALSDIDLYVPTARIPTAEVVLTDEGYVPALQPTSLSPYRRDWARPDTARMPRTLMLVHAEDPWSIDLQDSLNRRLQTGVVVALDQLIADTTMPDWPKSPAARVLGQPLLTLHLAAHASEHLGNLTLIRLTELAWVIRQDSMAGALDWGTFSKAATEIGGLRRVYPALLFTERLAPGTVPAGVLGAAEHDTPRTTRTVLSRLDLATLQPLDRNSAREYFMWAGSWRERGAQFLFQLAPAMANQPLAGKARIYGTRLRALLRGTLRP